MAGGGIELATAYVNVVAKADKSSFDGVEKGAKDAGSKGGSSYEGGFLGGLKGIGGKLVAALGTAAVVKGIADIGKAALDGYAEFEQLEGGVKKLFGDESAQAVSQYASEAYKTAGLSANAYMDTVTGFSASLITSLGGDTQKAADVADMAVRDMSDNANTFGTDIESIQNAYQGFAKNNYTMLDNLKLGYAGSQDGMKQLLARAEEITGRKFELGNFADMSEAIHVVQEDLNIAGTTSKEAMGTIEGSVNMAKGAWENWVTGLGNSEADMAQLTANLVDSVVAVASNIVPRIAVIAGQLVASLPGVAAQIVEGIPAAVDGIVAGIDAALGTSFGEMQFGAQAQELLDRIGAALAPLGEAILNLADSALPVLQGAFEAALPVVESVAGALGGFVEAVLPVLTDAINNVAGVIDVVAPYISAAVDTYMGYVKGVIDDVWPHIQDVITGVMDVINGIISTVLAVINGDWQGAWDGIQQVAQGAWDIISGLVEAGVSAVWNLIQSGLGFIQGIWEAGWDTVMNFLTNTFDSIKDGVSGGIDAVLGFFGDLPGNILSALGNLGSLLFDAGSSILSGFLDGLRSMWGAVTDFVGGIAGWIAEHKGPLPYDARLLIPAGKAIMGGFESALRDGYEDVQDFVGGIGGDVQASMTVGGRVRTQADATAEAVRAGVVAALSGMGGLRLEADSRGLAVYLAGDIDRELGRLSYMGV